MKIRHIRKLSLFILIFILFTFGFSGCLEENGSTLNKKQLNVHFIDVGQGDAILIQTPSGQTMMIDAGGNAAEDSVVSYLKDQEIEKIDVLVATHPHEDHIGGMDSVVKTFDIGEIYMPRVVHTTKTFQELLETVKEKGLNIKAAKAGMSISLEGLEVKILSPNENTKFKDLNNYSIVIRLEYGDTAFLFQGDAEKEAEEAILEAEYPLKADVIKIGHHGSSTSSSREYIEAASPSYGVLMLAKDNKYGHPHKETLKLLKEKNIKVYRTDECGTIIAASDGQDVFFY